MRQYSNDIAARRKLIPKQYFPIPLQRENIDAIVLQYLIAKYCLTIESRLLPVRGHESGLMDS
jgi:hypothetical protein